jgi:hypothetical protein
MWIRNLFDPGSGMEKIWDKHPGSTKLVFLNLFRSGIIIAAPQTNPLLFVLEISLNSRRYKFQVRL